MDQTQLIFHTFTNENDFLGASTTAKTAVILQPSTDLPPPNTDSNNSLDIPGNSHPVHTTPTSASGKKRDWSKVVRKFHHHWTGQFAVIERDQKPFCLICQKPLSQMKVHTIRQHYQKLHGDFESRFRQNSESRITEIDRLTALIPFGGAPYEATYSRLLADYKVEEEEDPAEEELDDDEADSDDDQLDPIKDPTVQSIDFGDANFETTTTTNSESNLSTCNNPDPNSKAKRRDWTKVVRKFHHEWTDQYLVIESVQEQKPLCLICHKTISAMKVHNIKRHYMQLHSVYFDHCFPPGSLGRKNELCRLIEELRKNQELNSTFVSILATPDLYEMDVDDGDASDDEDSSSGPIPNGTRTMFAVQQQGQNPPQGHSTLFLLQQHQAHYNQLKNSSLSVEKLELAFSHLDKFLAVIEQNDPNVQRSFKVRNAIDVVVDCYKHLLKDLKIMAASGPSGSS